MFNTLTDVGQTLTGLAGLVMRVQQDMEDRVLDAPDDNTLKIHQPKDGEQ
jgi:hypothetical protein